MAVSRRSLIAGSVAGAAAIGAGAIALAPHDATIPGTLGGADFRRGHKLRQGSFPPAERVEKTRITIIGGGVAGLSAAWALADAGVTDFRLLELEDGTGGNARAGRNAVSAYPLGAHYLPLPNEEAKGVRRLLEQLGILTGWQDGKPVYDPYQIVADPAERLLWQGEWQEGLVPLTGVTREDAAHLKAFFAAMRSYREHRDAAGRPAFAIPMALSAPDPDLLALDSISFTQWLDQRGWTSPVLRGHVRYACRDDYGTEPDQVSAWAGIHYFASRRGHAANAEPGAVLTWPEGNGHLVGRMAARLKDHLTCGRIVHRVAPTPEGVRVECVDAATGKGVAIEAEVAIMATPHFVTARITAGARPATGFDYAPWIVAAVTVDRLPGGPGFGLAWDNVSWTAASLGYVVDTHQSLDSMPRATVLSWYMPLSDMPPAEARKLLLEHPLEDFQALVRNDLLAMNPELRHAIRRIDIWRWGHAMIRPVPGFFFGGAREAAAEPRPPLFFAHSDLSGLSLFEEAHYRGTRAAEDAMRHLAIPYQTILT